jgi:1-acyl-sn-glycerol-3-phosphate acyltransferase
VPNIEAKTCVDFPHGGPLFFQLVCASVAGEGPVVLLSLLKLLGIACNTVLLAPVVVAASMVDGRWGYRLSRLWVRLNLLLSGVRVHARREVPLDPHAAYVFMSNHQSHFDVLAVVAALPEFQLRWVAKKELTRVPLFGWALAHSDHIIIDRSNHVQAMATLRAAAEKMRQGLSVIIFPEGTRGAGDGTLLPFKKGGFVLAQEAGFPIVPLVVAGSADVLSRRGWHIHGGDIDVLVGTPIPVAGLDSDQLMARVREHLERLLPRTRTRRVAPPRLAEAR